MGGSLGAKIFVFYVCVYCVCLLFRQGWSEALIKYTGKYVKIYFIIKITCCCYYYVVYVVIIIIIVFVVVISITIQTENFNLIHVTKPFRAPMTVRPSSKITPLRSQIEKVYFKKS